MSLTDNMAIIYTNHTNAMDMVILPTSQNTFIVQVKACREVDIVLSHIPGETEGEAYRIEMGELTRITNLDSGVRTCLASVKINNRPT